MASLGKHPNYNITTSVSVYVTYPSDEKATVTFDYTSVVGTYTSVLSSGVKVKTVCNGATKGANAIVGCRNSGDWDSAGTYTKSHSFNISRTSSDQSISFTAYALTQGEATIGSYSDSVSIKAKPVTTAAFNLNILLPDGSEPYTTGAAGTVQFSSNAGLSYSRVYNEPASSYPIGTSFKFRYFIPGVGMHLSSVSGATLSGNEYVATMPASGLTVTFSTAWNTYTVSYNANGGSGAPSAQTKTYGQTLTLSSTVPTRAGYTFQGWATSSTATTANYSAGGSFTINATTTLYAVWKLIPSQNIYIYKNGYIYARQFIESNDFYFTKEGDIYAPSFIIGDKIGFSPLGLMAVAFISGFPPNSYILIDSDGNILTDENSNILRASL